jgi:hypothetical protein
MTPDEIYRFIQSTNTTLAFDTSVTARRGFLDFCDQALRVNTKREVLGKLERIELCIPVAAHIERLFDLAQEHGDRYNVDRVNHILKRYQITIPEFTIMDAEHCADLLFQRYKTPDEWYAFKKRRCLECIGLPVAQYNHLAEGTGQQCGAPNDWLIIAQADRQKMLLIMDDQGRAGEYDLIENKVRSNDLRSVLEWILDELAIQLKEN